SPSATPVLHSFPTRRSSDLGAIVGLRLLEIAHAMLHRLHNPFLIGGRGRGEEQDCGQVHRGTRQMAAAHGVLLSDVRSGERKARSEEHTSELQSQSNLVCRL